MEKEFDKKGWVNGYAIALMTAAWVMASVLDVAQSGLVA
jgi:hypothetical protein